MFINASGGCKARKQKMFFCHYNRTNPNKILVQPLLKEQKQKVSNRYKLSI